MQPGEEIRVKAYGGAVLVRRVVFISDTHVYVCKEGEYVAVIQEEREPVCVGFRREYVLSTGKPTPSG